MPLAERAAAFALAAALLGAAPPQLPCREVGPGEDLAALLAAAPRGSAFCLAPGSWPGPIELDGTLLRGPRSAVIRSGGEGTTVRLLGDGAALLGVSVDGSGHRFDTLDAAIHVAGRNARVEGVEVRGALFGILVERATGVVLRSNELIGDPSAALGLRGDGIRLWEANDCTIEANAVRAGRDVVLWYSSRNRVLRNRVEGGRYGAHLMYSHENRIAGNRFAGNTTGLFVMYSRGVEVEGNTFADSGGAAGIGLGLKESGNLSVRGNLFAHNTVGLYLASSPLWPDDRNAVEGNLFHLNEVAVSLLGRGAGNEFRSNDFHDSRVHLEVAGGGDAQAVAWRGNEFDDYAGFDLDGDGTGDVPYELRSVSGDLVAARPALAFFRGTPALALAEAIGRLVPLFEPRLLLVDPEPRVFPLPLGGFGAD